MTSIITAIVQDADVAPTVVSSVAAQISAVSFADGVSALASLATSLSSGAASLPSGALVAAEDIAGMIDPALIPIIGGVQQILPLVTTALGMLSGAGAATGIVRGQRGQAGES